MVKKGDMLPVKNAQNYVRFVRRKIVHVIVRNAVKANKNALAKKSVKSVINYNHFANAARKIQRLNLM